MTADAAIVRCDWCGDDPLYQRYHDEEWGGVLDTDTGIRTGGFTIGTKDGVDGWSADLTKAQTAASELASKLVAMRGGGAAPKAEEEPAAPSSQGLIDVPTPSGVSNPLRTTAEV